VIGFLINVFLALALAFFVLRDLPTLKSEILALPGPERREESFALAAEVTDVVEGFIRGQGIIAIIVGTLTALGLWVLGVPYALLIGLIAGITNLIPYLGPLVGGAIAAISAAFVSPQLVFWTIVYIVVIQQLESTFLQPRIMSDQVHLHPVLVILSLLVGATLFGLVGMLFAVPIAGVAKVMFVHYFEKWTASSISHEQGALFRKPKRRGVVVATSACRLTRMTRVGRAADLATVRPAIRIHPKESRVKTADIRESFSRTSRARGARRVASSSLIPDDPSLLLTSAGMVQFKPVFLGVKDLGFTRATTCQKCVRTTDIDIIGTTNRHHSFFEMLGNFSFGDYFKSEACAWAQEYSVEVLGLDPDKLWYSIYEDDDEAEEIWAEEVGVPRERIVRMGAKDNFWSAGPTGPCGPCSELYYDQGEEVGCGLDSCAPGCDCDRFLEYWNLVFMQYDRAEDGTLTPLPKQNIDTGMGLERVATILQGVHSNFETDELRCDHGARRGADRRRIRLLREDRHVASDPHRPCAGGHLPDRRRRVALQRRPRLRAAPPAAPRDPPRAPARPDRSVVGRDVDVVVETMGAAYPEIVEHHDLVRRISDAEEQRFSTTLRQGLAFLGDEIDRLKQEGVAELDGKIAFTLHDTYGFPVELTAEIVAEAGLGVEMDVFESEMQAQRTRARAAVKDESWTSFASAFNAIAANAGETEFVGYERDDVVATVIGLVVDGSPVEEIADGTSAEVVLDRTPFYAEQGGQVGDHGVIASEGGAVFEVADTTFPLAGVISHRGALSSGALRLGDTVTATIDVMRRERIRRNHTATHLLHWALRLVLGDHVHQSGSHVAPDRFRFDFTHFEAPGADQLEKVERMVNAKVMESHPVRSYETSLRSAKEAGVTALFGEKYGEFVRVLEVGNFSKELCGGTHVARTTEIGLVKVVSEGSVGANLRRIEAVTSFDALAYIEREESELAEAAVALKVQRFDVSERVGTLIKRVKELESASERVTSTLSSASLDEVLASAVDVGYPLVVARVPDMQSKGLRMTADILRARLSGGAVVLATSTPDDGVPLLLAAGSDEAVNAGFDAGAVIKAIAPHVKGGGGGKPAMAQAGGKDASGIDVALVAARTMLGVPE
jgi:alanyl-tRNA synthetase